MDSMEVNKGIAAVLVAGIAFMVSSLIAGALVSPTPLKESAIKVEGVQPAGAAPAQEAKPQPIGPLLASADPAAGEALTKKLCAACHTFNEGGKASVGPNLFGVVGAPHGHMEGFAYSDALKSKQGPWTYDGLNEWLTKPSAYAPGTKMTFAGLSSEKQRADVIAFLRTLSHNPEPLPAATSTAAPAAQTGNPQAGNAGAPNTATQGTETGKAAGETQPKAQQGGPAQ